LCVAAIAAHEVQGARQTTAPPLDRAVIREAVESVAAVVGREYFDAALGTRAEHALRRRLGEGDYAGAKSLHELAEWLTRDLFAATRDKHIDVGVNGGSASPAPDSDQSREMRGRRSNFGVQRAEILAGNVGYLNLTALYRPEEARDVIAHAMALLRHADALILDLRGNAGGSPDTAALVAGYFLEADGVPLFEIVPRSGATRRYATEATPLPYRDAKRPMSALISKSTFSGGEGLAFLLQEHRRAEIVGERTAGAANAGRAYPTAHFNVRLSNGRLRTALRGTSWEGDGVMPDVSVPAPDALRVAHLRLVRALLKATPPGRWHGELTRLVEALEKSNP